MFHLTTAESTHPDMVIGVSGDEGIDLDTGWDAFEEWLAEQPGEAGSWEERARCQETDPEAFFPEKGGSTREAKRICAGCEVRAECLDYALARDERFGVWGGLSERERRRLRREDAGSSESLTRHPGDVAMSLVSPPASGCAAP